MLTEQIINIFQKYKEINQKEIIEISSNLEKIENSLRDIRNNLSKHLQEIANSDEIENDGSELLGDINLLKNQLRTVQALSLRLQRYSVVKTEHLFNDKIIVYLIDDDVCPECGGGIQEILVEYQKQREGMLCDERINFYECPVCKKIYAPYFDVENFDTNNTNIIFDSTYLQKLSMYADIYVVNDIRRCSNNHHYIKDITCVIPVIDKNGKINLVPVDISYCKTCQTYYMLKYTLDNLQGIPVCKIVDNTKEKTESEFDKDIVWEGESKLHFYGYNVNCIDKLTEQQRQMILITQIITKNMTKNEIISYLNRNIQNGEKRSNSKKNWDNAIKKWRADLSFVIQLKVEQYSDINVNKLILSYTNNIKTE